MWHCCHFRRLGRHFTYSAPEPRAVVDPWDRLVPNGYLQLQPGFPLGGGNPHEDSTAVRGGEMTNFVDGEDVSVVRGIGWHAAR